jgi:hypothetical protein
VAARAYDARVNGAGLGMLAKLAAFSGGSGGEIGV